MLRNFRFILKGKLAGMGHPGYRDTLPQTLDELRKHGIGAIVSLDEEGIMDDIVASHGFAYRHYPIDDFCAPTMEQALDFVKFVDEQTARGHGVVAHCWAGIGRTGTMLACYLIHRGDSAQTALKKIRRIGGIESREQEKFLEEFEQYCRTKAKKDAPSGETNVDDFT
ncbi:MAG: dual specificity protein phosphatase family protein [Candidatus Sumerlaeia bacterium]|nr:dual specificity protein phosphatase family protein [Candidatus Sumerlaeia bacterium]